MPRRVHRETCNTTIVYTRYAGAYILETTTTTTNTQGMICDTRPPTYVFRRSRMAHRDPKDARRSTDPGGGMEPPTCDRASLTPHRRPKDSGSSRRRWRRQLRRPAVQRRRLQPVSREQPPRLGERTWCTLNLFYHLRQGSRPFGGTTPTRTTLCQWWTGCVGGISLRVLS